MRSDQRGGRRSSRAPQPGERAVRGDAVDAQRVIARLESRARSQDARLSALEAQARENDAALADLQARARDKDATVVELSQRLAAAQPGRTAVLRAAWRTAWTSAAGAARAAFVIARAASGVWRSRAHAMRLEPYHHLVPDGDGFRSLGDDPQFLLYSDRGRLPRAWAVISFAVELRGQWLSPKLYVDDGRGFSEERSFALPVRAGRRVECMVGLPYRVRALRLDPLAAPGTFVLRDVHIREVGLVQLLSALLPEVRASAARPRELLRRAGLALGMLRSGGGRALTESLMARDREVSDYQDWIDAYDTATEIDRALMRRHIDTLGRRPLVSVLMATYDTPEVYLRRAIESVRGQLYPHWELCIADDASPAPHVRRVLEEYRTLDSRIKITYRASRGLVSAALNTALASATGDCIALLDQEDELAERALYLVAVELDAHPHADVLYSDEDRISAQGQRFHPYFKPDWNPDLFLSQNLATHLCVCRTEAVREVGGFRSGYEGAHDWDLAMRLLDRLPAPAIRHLPHVLYHWRAQSGSAAVPSAKTSSANASHYRTLASHFERRGARVQIQVLSGHAWRVRYPLPQPAPLLSVIIPTRDHGALLRRCVASLRALGGYPQLQIVIVDNQSSDWATLAYLAELAAEPDVTVIRYDAPFNYSALNNAGVLHARGELLMLLNNDVEVISPGAVEEMVSQAWRPEIGAVGAMLYYPDDTIQHAGVVLGLGSTGIAGHAYAFRPRGFAGQSGRGVLMRNVSAVTAACMVVRRQVFDEVGGFDETHLAIAYNDLDLCLRIGARGYRNLWTPHAQFYHLESASRGRDDTSAKRARFRREIECIRARWGAVLQNDPAYNPNLSLAGDSFTLAFPPRTPKPWLDV